MNSLSSSHFEKFKMNGHLDRVEEFPDESNNISPMIMNKKLTLDHRDNNLNNVEDDVVVQVEVDHADKEMVLISTISGQDDHDVSSNSNLSENVVPKNINFAYISQ